MYVGNFTGHHGLNLMSFLKEKMTCYVTVVKSLVGYGVSFGNLALDNSTWNALPGLSMYNNTGTTRLDRLFSFKVKEGHCLPMFKLCMACTCLMISEFFHKVYS